jgi:hypothetical protein
MRIVAVGLTIRMARSMGFKPWSRQAMVLLRLILSTAQRTPNNPWIRFSKREKVLLAAETLAEGSKARETLADALEVSSLSAWTLQRDMGSWLRGATT